MQRRKLHLLASCALLPAFFSPASPSIPGRPSGSSADAPSSAPELLCEARQDTAAKHFIAIFSLGAKWEKDKPAHEQPHFKEHSANLQKLRQEKKIVLGARYADKGVIILAARDAAEARAWLANDPMVVHELFNLEIHPFSPFYTGCIEKK